METRGWDDGRQATYRMRAKETSDDYRYFPEPDLPPLHVEPAWIAGIRDGAAGAAGGAPGAVRGARASPAYDAAVIVADPAMTAAFEAISRRPAPDGAREGGRELRDRAARAGAQGGRRQRRRDRRARRRRRASRRCSRRSSTGRVSRPVGRELLDRHLADGTPADDLLAGAGPGPIADDAALLAHVDAVIAANPKAVADYRGGQARRRVLRRPGHEGDRRRGRRRPGHAARPRAPGGWWLTDGDS